MSVADLDALVNDAMDVFREEVVFAVRGASVSSRAEVILESEADSVGTSPIDAVATGLEIPLAELRRVGARAGGFVTVRGVKYTLLEDADDPVVDAGGMARISIRQYS